MFRPRQTSDKDPEHTHERSKHERPADEHAHAIDDRHDGSERIAVRDVIGNVETACDEPRAGREPAVKEKRDDGQNGEKREIRRFFECSEG